MITIAIAENNKDEQLKLRNLIAAQTNCKVVIEANNGKELVKKIHKANKPPEVIFMNMQMRPGDGLITTNYCTVMFKQTKVVGMCSQIYPHLIEEVICEGACGFLTKNILYPPTVEASITSQANSILYDCIQTIKTNKPYFDPYLNQQNFTALKPKSTASIIKENYSEFTSKHLQTLLLMCMGFCNEEIGEVMNKSRHQAKNYCMQVEQLLGEKERAQLILLATQLGIVKTAHCFKKYFAIA